MSPDAHSDKLEQARALIAQNDLDRAREVLLEIIDSDDTHEAALILFGSIAPTRQDRYVALERVVTLNPQNDEAWRALWDFDAKWYFVLQLRLVYTDWQAVGTSRAQIHKTRVALDDAFTRVLVEGGYLMTKAERARLFDSVTAELLGYGPLEILLADESVTLINVNGSAAIHHEQKARLTLSTASFETDYHLWQSIERMIEPFGITLDQSAPLVNTRLPDGSSVTVAVPPLTQSAPVLSIRKYTRPPFRYEDWIRFGSISSDLTEFLRACVISGLNILIVGEAGAGKTTLVNILSSFVPQDERIITLERVMEYQIQIEHVVSTEITPFPPNINSLLAPHRPDRLYFGELMPAEILHFIDACAFVTTCATLRARTARAALIQMETAMLAALPHLTPAAVRQMITRAINLVVVLRTLPDGARKVIDVVDMSHVTDFDNPSAHSLYTFERTGIENNKIVGRIRATGVMPSFMTRIENAGIHLPPSVFGY